MNISRLTRAAADSIAKTQYARSPAGCGIQGSLRKTFRKVFGSIHEPTISSIHGFLQVLMRTWSIPFVVNAWGSRSAAL